MLWLVLALFATVVLAALLCPGPEHRARALVDEAEARLGITPPPSGDAGDDDGDPGEDDEAPPAWRAPVRGVPAADLQRCRDTLRANSTPLIGAATDDGDPGDEDDAAEIAYWERLNADADRRNRARAGR